MQKNIAKVTKNAKKKCDQILCKTSDRNEMQSSG